MHCSLKLSWRSSADLDPKPRQQEVPSLRSNRDRLAVELAEQRKDLTEFNGLLPIESERRGTSMEEVASLHVDRDCWGGKLAEQGGDLAELRELPGGEREQSGNCVKQTASLR